MQAGHCPDTAPLHASISFVPILSHMLVVLCCRAAYVAAFTCICSAGVSPALCWGVSFWAAIVAVSRAALGRHYAGDVLAGLLVGIINMGFTTRGTYSPAGFWVDAAQMEHLSKLAIMHGRRWFSSSLMH